MFFKENNIYESLIYREDDPESYSEIEQHEGGEEKLIEMGPDEVLDRIENAEKVFKEVKRAPDEFSKLKFCLPLVYAGVFGGLNQLAWYYSRQGVEDGNKYTINHWNFNDNLTQFVFKTALLVWLILNTLRP